jgi:hypothetical protein
MSVSNEVAVYGKCLKVRMTGLMNPEWARQSLSVFKGHVEQCERMGLRGLLYDIRDVDFKLGIMDLYVAGENLAAGSRAGVKVAVLMRPEQMTPDRFLETVAANRGAAVRVCLHEPEAHDWLGCCAS